MSLSHQARVCVSVCPSVNWALAREAGCSLRCEDRAGRLSGPNQGLAWGQTMVSHCSWISGDILISPMGLGHPTPPRPSQHLPWTHEAAALPHLAPSGCRMCPAAP